jgi:hypothetical protein
MDGPKRLGDPVPFPFLYFSIRDFVDMEYQNIWTPAVSSESSGYADMNF